MGVGPRRTHQTGAHTVIEERFFAAEDAVPIATSSYGIPLRPYVNEFVAWQILPRGRVVPRLSIYARCGGLDCARCPRFWKSPERQGHKRVGHL